MNRFCNISIPFFLSLSLHCVRFYFFFIYIHFVSFKYGYSDRAFDLSGNVAYWEGFWHRIIKKLEFLSEALNWLLILYIWIVSVTFLYLSFFLSLFLSLFLVFVFQFFLIYIHLMLFKYGYSDMAFDPSENVAYWEGFWHRIIKTWVSVRSSEFPYSQCFWV